MAQTVARHLPEWLNQRLPERLNRDEVRSPMQWTAAPHAGFCPPDVAPWLPTHDNVPQRNVESQVRDPDSLLTWYRTLLALRAEREALREGRLELAADTARHVIRYDRVGEHERIVVVANLGDALTEMRLGEGATLLAASDPGCGLNDGAVTLPPHTAVVALLG